MFLSPQLVKSTQLPMCPLSAGGTSLGNKAAGTWVYLTPSIDKLKNAWNCTFAYNFMACSLKLYSPVVCTICFNLLKLCIILKKVYLCVPYSSHSK
jgi:hypothetical protein